MHDFTAPISKDLAAALHRVWKEPTAVDWQRASRDMDTHAQAAQLDDWEDEGGTTLRRST
jgi:hypothetical protein